MCVCVCVCVAVGGGGGGGSGVGDDLLPVLKTVCERGCKTELTYSSREKESYFKETKTKHFLVFY